MDAVGMLIPIRLLLPRLMLVVLGCNPVTVMGACGAMLAGL